jgi:hypothetical protein
VFASSPAASLYRAVDDPGLPCPIIWEARRAFRRSFLAYFELVFPEETWARRSVRRSPRVFLPTGGSSATALSSPRVVVPAGGVVD